MIQFQYSGYTRAVTVLNTSRVYYTLIGGCGGGGGNDSSAGTRGTSGGKLGGYIDVEKDDVLYVAVGGGGGAGGSGRGNALGGYGGYSLRGFGGGYGGNAGAYGSSGAGGGGGGATVLYKKSGNTRTTIGVAHGGGGGGGGGNGVPGSFVSDTFFASSAATIPSSYAPAPQHGEYSAIANSYGVQIFSSRNNTWNRLSWAYNAPTTGTYTLRYSVDNYGHFYVNGYIVATSPTWGNESEPRNHSSYVESYIYLNAGINILSATYADLGREHMVAAAIYNSSMNLVWTTRDATNKNLVPTMGSSGQAQRGDGGGGGGGGGGATGGAGGRVAGDEDYSHYIYGGPVGSADWGGMSGSPGYSFNTSGTSYSDGAGNGTMKLSYGTYGQATENGSSGYAALYSKDSKLAVLSGSSWKPIYGVYIKQPTYWAEAKQVYVRKDNAWVSVYGDNIPSSEYSSEPFDGSSWGERTYTQY